MKRLAFLAGLLACGLASVTYGTTGVRVSGVFTLAGTTSEVQEAQVNQSLWLVVKVQDISSPNPQGVAGGKVDVSWDPNVVELLNTMDSTNTTTNDAQVLFSSPWTQFFTGIRPNASQPVLKDIGAGQGVPPQLTMGYSTTFFTLNFTAKAPGSAGVRLTPHDFGVIGPGLAQTYETQNPVLTVTEAETPTPPVITTPCMPSAAALFASLGIGVAGLVAGRRRR
jgi:hypothetical protein